MPIGGGDSHPACRIVTDKGDWFLKWNQRNMLEQFQAERDGLAMLADSDPQGLFIPTVTSVDHDHRLAWLLLPWMELDRSGDPAQLAEGLVKLHKVRRSDYGWDRNNFLGRSPQSNAVSTNWDKFWWQQRLLPQFERACQKGWGAALEPHLAVLERRTEQLLDHQPVCSLLHGDLWSGNQGWLTDGRPVIFDPAPYFGDRETDLAMMRLFGGFSAAVFETYQSLWPLPPGAVQRSPLYQLYHLLNHLNLFGDGWLPRVQQVMDTLIMEEPLAAKDPGTGRVP